MAVLGTRSGAVTDDIKTLEKQLGRKPHGTASVVSRCAYGCPQVIQNDVLMDGKPFPTLYWLTCPLKVKAVSRIEGQGWAERIKRMVEESEEFKARLLAAHDDYRGRRKLAASGIDHAAFETGIGGVHDVEGIKCLHAHYAHYLATANNPLGEMIDEFLDGLNCERRCDSE